MSTLKFRGVVVPDVDPESLTPGEADAIERVVGMTMAKINRVRSKCVCEHYARLHQHTDAEGAVVEDDSSCTDGGCDCDEFESDVPVNVSTALTWVAIKRATPGTSFADVQNSGADAFEVEDDEEDGSEPDPTEPPQTAA